MADDSLEFRKLQLEADLKKAELSAGVRKVIYGTLVVGVAASLFPFMERLAESYFSESIEKIKRESEIELLQEKNRLESALATQRHQLSVTEQQGEHQKRSREYLESLASEARSEDISRRIILAEFFSYMAEDADERARWASFRDHLYDLQEQLNQDREEALAIINNPASTPGQIEAAINRLRQVDTRENPAGAASGRNWNDPVDFKALGIDRNAINGDLSIAGPAYLTEQLGPPAEIATSYCSAPTNPRLVAALRNERIGSMRVHLLAPAVASLQRIIERVAQDEPELAEAIGSAGTLCARLIRGSTTLFSSHSWGTSIDITIGGQMDHTGDGRTNLGLLTLSAYFIDEGWIWGAGFRSEDAGHFEVSRQRIDEWIASGLLPTPSPETSTAN